MFVGVFARTKLGHCIERITVYNDGRLVFTFRNGSEETVMM